MYIILQNYHKWRSLYETPSKISRANVYTRWSFSVHDRMWRFNMNEQHWGSTTLPILSYIPKLLQIPNQVADYEAGRFLFNNIQGD